MTVSNSMQHIDDILKGGGNVVTYRLLSRQAGVSVNNAKELLEEYKTSHRGKVHASYLVTGEVEAASNSGDGLDLTTEIRVVPQELLDEVKSGYVNFTVHIYSIENSPIKNNDVFANVESEVNKNDSLDLMAKCRILKNPNITYTDRPLFSTKDAPPSKLQPAAIVQPPLVKPTLQKHSSIVSAASSKPKPDSKKPLTKANSATSKTSFFATQIKQDEERKQKAAFVESAKQAERDKVKEKVRAEAVKDAFVNRDLDAKLMGMFDNEEEEVTFSSSQTNTRKRGVESDDEGDSDQDDHETKRLRLMAKLSTDPNANDDDDEEEDAFQKPALSPQEPMAVDDEVVSPINQPDVERTTRRVRRRRKVVKKVTVQVGKYMETKDVEGWESYSEDEVVPVVKSVPKIPVMQKPLPTAVVVVEEKNSEATGEDNKKVSPTKSKGKAVSKKAAANAGQKLISSFFKK
ncbi:UNVERIFIED_CONTAM: hypothetical protein HDU68_002163 [Siphonaria sp. JEL0065]|nr:hypothetical protein HDU68_002163 [Siphonaria sp. JEL0065]